MPLAQRTVLCSQKPWGFTTQWTRVPIWRRCCFPRLLANPWKEEFFPALQWLFNSHSEIDLSSYAYEKPTAPLCFSALLSRAIPVSCRVSCTKSISWYLGSILQHQIAAHNENILQKTANHNWNESIKGKPEDNSSHLPYYLLQSDVFRAIQLYFVFTS